MFDSIANKYDLLNHILSFGIDIYWRKKAISFLKKYAPLKILDIGTGTADFAIEATKLNPELVIGIDISNAMLEIARKKVAEKKLDNIIKLELGNAEKLHFASDFFDSIISSFSVRNFENLNLGLSEMLRVLKRNGVAIILEFSKPKNRLISFFYNIYLRLLLPIIGGIFSKNYSAYKYLPDTIAEFPDGDTFCAVLQSVGFKKAIFYPQTFGIATIYIAIKD